MIPYLLPDKAGKRKGEAGLLRTAIQIVGILSALFSVLSVLFCIYDKFAAKHLKRYRVPEFVLFLLAALGGALAMYLTMLLIRHKTRHLSFMLGIPLIFLLQLFLLLFVFCFLVYGNFSFPSAADLDFFFLRCL